MSQEYASNKPQGFKNCIENVVIVGAGGQVGKHIVEHLLKTGKHKVTALTRLDSTSTIAPGVEVKKVNYDDKASLTEALRGQDFFIITMAVTAPKDQQAKLIDAAAAADVPWVMPNEFGSDHENPSLAKDTMIGEGILATRKYIDEVGKLSWVGLACSFWYEYSLGMSPLLYGFDFTKREVTFFDDGKTRINTSTWPQCGRAVASLLSLKVLKDDANDKSPCLSDFKSRTVFISSFLISQRDMLDSAIRVTGTKEADWKITYEPTAERYKAGMEALQKGGMREGFAKLLYARVFYPNGDGNYEQKRGLQNELLGLPKEDLDEYTKLAIEIAKTSTFGQFASGSYETA